MAPSTPTITVATPNNNSTPSIAFSSIDSVGVFSYQVKIDSGDFSTQISPYTTPALTEGSHTITVRAYDAAGNYTDGTATVVIDLTAPVITINGESKITLPIGSTYAGCRERPPPTILTARSPRQLLRRDPLIQIKRIILYYIQYYR